MQQPATNVTQPSVVPVRDLAEALRAIDSVRQRAAWHRLPWPDKLAIRTASDLMARVVLKMLDDAREPEPTPPAADVVRPPLAVIDGGAAKTRRAKTPKEVA